MRGKPWLVASMLLMLPACVSRRVEVPPLIPPTCQASESELVALVNGRQRVDTFTARADLQFETAEAAEAGVLRRYRSAQGRLLLARPENIRLQIEAPLLGVSIAEMASDGRRFRLLIYPEEHRALIEGSNDRPYVEEARKLERDPELRKAGPLVNIRPQHFTEAILFPAIDAHDPDTIVIKEEARILEDDDRPGAAKGRKVIKSYWVLTVIRRGDKAPERKYWFDRGPDCTLARQQVFDTKGLLIGDTRYSRYLSPDPTTGERFASTIRIERPYEGYSLSILLKPDSVGVNREISPQAFSLEPPPEWGDSIRRIDLDRKGQGEHQTLGADPAEVFSMEMCLPRGNLRLHLRRSSGASSGMNSPSSMAFP